MKRILITGTFAIALSFGLAGCGAKNGLSVNTMDGNHIDRYFHKGSVKSIRKVMIDDSMATTLKGAGTGALVGAAGGAALSKDNKKGAVNGAIVGVVAGTLVGLFSDNEIEAYETVVESNGKEYIGFIERKLSIGTFVEFTIKDGAMKNVEIVRKNDNGYVSTQKIYQIDSNNDNDEIIKAPKK